MRAARALARFAQMTPGEDGSNLASEIGGYGQRIKRGNRRSVEGLRVKVTRYAAYNPTHVCCRDLCVLGVTIEGSLLFPGLRLRHPQQLLLLWGRSPLRGLTLLVLPDGPSSSVPQVVVAWKVSLLS